MKRVELENMSVQQLVEQFAALCVSQDKAERSSRMTEYKKLFWQMMRVEEELKSRSDDQRKALLSLYNHSNMQVRLAAAKATLAIAPAEARQMLEWIANSGWFPQAGDAGMSLANLDRGVFKPT